MNSRRGTYRKYDWTLIICCLALMFFGWINIFSVLHGENSNIFDFSQKYGMHFIWICISVVTAVLIIRVLPANLWQGTAAITYGLVILLLIATLVMGVSSHGSRSWISIGSFRLQPAEFSKITTSLALAAVMGKYGFSLKRLSDVIKVVALLILPMALILLEKETGSVLVYVGFLVVLFREGMSGWIIGIGFFILLLFILTITTSAYMAMSVAITLFLIIYFFKKEAYFKGTLYAALAILLLYVFHRILRIEAVAAVNPLPAETWIAILASAASLVFIVLLFWFPRKRFERRAFTVLLCMILFVVSVDFFYEKVLQEHQRNRIDVFLRLVDDPKGVGYNLHQSMVAIGSGGFAGKGFMNGTQTSLGYVPEQETDFIFCTIGEEWGLLGALAVLALYLTIIGRVIVLADKAKDAFTRIFGYCTAMCLAVHVVINIGMTIGLMPVIGIPLPFLSYGGSALLAFSIMISIFIKLIYTERKK